MMIKINSLKYVIWMLLYLLSVCLCFLIKQTLILVKNPDYNQIIKIFDLNVNFQKQDTLFFNQFRVNFFFYQNSDLRSAY